MERTKVLEFWGKPERNQIAAWYDGLPSGQFDRAFQQEVRQLVERSFVQATDKYWVKWVTGQPYETADEMREYLAEHGGLLISTDFNTTDADIMPPQVNLWFRFAHDIDHCHTANCNFAFRGEVCAYSKFAARATTWELRQWLFTEIVGQAASRGTNGTFADQKFALAPYEWALKVAQEYRYE